MDKIQTEIPFELVEKELTKRRADFRIEASKYFSKLQVDMLVRLVFDLTHKDFEYFTCYLLEKEFYNKPDVTSKELDQKWVDIIAKKWDIDHLFQCKQWSSKYIDIKQIGAAYAKLYTLQKVYPNSNIYFITTCFLSDDSRSFLKDHKVHFYWNKEIVDRAIMYNLHKPEYWSKLIEYIQSKRIKEYNQQRLPLWINDFERLLKDRLVEDAMHTISYKNYSKILIPQHESEIFNKFTEWWRIK